MKGTTHKATTRLHPILMGRFAANLKHERKRKGWTHDVFAAKAGITGGYVSLLESAQRAPSLEIVEQCAAALGLDPALLLRAPLDKTKKSDLKVEV